MIDIPSTNVWGRDFETPFAGPIGLESLIKSSYVWAEKGKECTDRRVGKMSNTFDIFSIYLRSKGYKSMPALIRKGIYLSLVGLGSRVNPPRTTRQLAGRFFFLVKISTRSTRKEIN